MRAAPIFNVRPRPARPRSVARALARRFAGPPSAGASSRRCHEGGEDALIELNRAERRALLMGTVLVVLGTGARIGLGPGAADYAWEPAPEPPASAADTGTTPSSPVEGVRAAVGESVERARRAARPLAPGERIDPNTAPSEELQRLTGVGPARARALIRERTEGGPFTDLEDLARVPGIGPVTLERLAPHLTLAGRAGASRRSTPGPGRRGDLIDVNRAPVELLRELPGVGPVVAERIVRTRARSGRFTTPEDLLEVPGIGPVRLAGLRDRIVIR